MLDYYVTCSCCIVKDSCHPQKREPASLSHDRPIFGGSGLNRSFTNGLSSSLNTGAWRTWSNQRAGFSDIEFEGIVILSLAGQLIFYYINP